MKTIQLDERYIKGAVSFEKGEGWVRPWRLVFENKSLFYSEDTLIPRAGHTAGVRLKFRTNADNMKLNVSPLENGRGFDLCSGGELLETAVLPKGEGTVSFTLTKGEGVYEIWLPQKFETSLRSIQVPDESEVSAADDTRLRWITYGSSVTQANGAYSSSRTWPAIIARKLDLNLTCLGFAGNCHLEPMVGMMIRDLPADLITLKLGVNIKGKSSLSDRTFTPAVIGFVKMIREKHPATPIGVISPFATKITEENLHGLYLHDYRDLLKNAVAILQDAGDEHLDFYEGEEVFGPENTEELLRDRVHPNMEGYEYIGNTMAEKVVGPLIEKYCIAKSEMGSQKSEMRNVINM